MADDRRFREVNDYAECHGFFSGFPNFHEADYGNGVVYGTILLRDTEAEWRDMPRTEYGVYHIEDVPAMFRAANDYAGRQGYPVAFPNFHQADHGNGVVYGTILIKQGITEWRDVPRDELGVYHIEDVPSMMRAANDYATRNGFAAGFPTFHQADHGQGVVCGIVLFLPSTTVWHDVPADLLRMYSAPPQPWAIILCNLTDVPPGLNSNQRYIEYFTEAGSGNGGAYDYWRDVSYCVGGLQGSQVFGWFDIGHTRVDLAAFSGSAQRNQIFVWGLDAARANRVDLAAFPHKIVVLNVSADHGKAGGGIVLAYEDTRALEPTFFFHEMGHEFGLDHSFGESNTPCASGDGRPGAYCDMFDIMSAMNVHSFQDAQNRSSGPTLNAISRERMGWLHRSQVKNLGKPISAETVVLAPLNRQDIEGYQLAKFLAPSRDPAQSILSTYTIEFKEPVSWDRAFLNPHVILHEIRTDGLVRLLTNFHGGHLDLDPNSEFVAPNSTVVVRLLGIDAAVHTATLRIWRLPKGGQRAVRLQEINYNPPGRDINSEYVLIQNDTSASVSMSQWTLRDTVNHVFTFPSFMLRPGFSVRVWTKAGTNDAENLFWGRRAAVWNNLGDTATLSDSKGSEVARYVY
jgi:hypothetical protein